MKQIYTTLLLLAIQLTVMAQGWPFQYKGVMLQGFSWDSFVDTQWTNLEAQADELSQYFSLIWIPQSGDCNSTYNQMGYTPVYYFKHNSSFGTEAQLRSMIQTFKQKGTGIIADVVVNHRNNMGVNGSWVDYPAEVYNGETYQMLPTDIVRNDDNGATLSWAQSKGIDLSQNNDEGEGWKGCRDLDHKSPNVQKIIKAYTKFLVDDLGYAGFRYDMVKGFNASHVRDYNDNAGVRFSVGEHWSGNNDISNWINYTEKRSAAFDFQFRYALRDAINNNNWTELGNKQYLVNNNYQGGSFKQYAVTFVENHDQQDRGTTQNYTPDPIRRDTLAANAFLLAMPGTPCVFLPHWKAYKQDIKAMIDVRNALGITNTSNYQQVKSVIQCYAVQVDGIDGSLVACVGSAPSMYTASNDFVEVLSGNHYRYFASKSSEMVFANVSSGKFYEPFRVKLTAASSNADAQIVYTLDGSTPTANSAKAASGTGIDITTTTTLTFGLLVNGTVRSVVSRKYVVQPFTPHDVTVYFKDPGWSTVKFYAWDNKEQLNGVWNGKTITDKKVINGIAWYYQSFSIPTSNYSFNIIFNNGSSQTVDIGPITTDKYYELGSMVGGKYSVNDLTKTVTAIQKVETDATAHPTHVDVYAIDGRLVRRMTHFSTALQGLQKGVYVVHGKKYVVK